MRCPRCDFDNPDDTQYCINCGTPLEEQQPPSETFVEYPTSDAEQPLYTEASIYGAYANQYQPAPPPPMNGHNRVLPPPPQPRYEYTTDPSETYTQQSQLSDSFKIHEESPRWTVGRVIRSIIYFIAAASSAFWLLAAFVEINQNGPLPYVGFAAGIVMLIASIVNYARLRRRNPRLNFSWFLLFFLAATGLAGIAAIIEAAIVPNISISPAASFILAMIFMAYFLAVAILALW